MVTLSPVLLNVCSSEVRQAQANARSRLTLDTRAQYDILTMEMTPIYHMRMYSSINRS